MELYLLAKISSCLMGGSVFIHILSCACSVLSHSLINPDIYLMDEPTNHLSKSAIEWITNYLLTLTHQTVVIVSHDTTFLENVCTDVIHYEQRDVWGPYRRLVHYKTKMSEFVQLQPQAKHYFELATTDQVKYVFPEPGRLEGVKTSTQKFLEMERVNFRYPGRERNTLTNIHLKMTLSSRVVVYVYWTNRQCLFSSCLIYDLTLSDQSLLSSVPLFTFRPWATDSTTFQIGCQWCRKDHLD